MENPFYNCHNKNVDLDDTNETDDLLFEPEENDDIIDNPPQKLQQHTDDDLKSHTVSTIGNRQAGRSVIRLTFLTTCFLLLICSIWAHGSETANFASLVMNYLEHITHTFLYYLQLYPQKSFRDTIYYGTNVKTCQSSEVVSYIKSALQPLSKQLSHLREFHLLLHSSAHGQCKVLRKLVIKFSVPANWHRTPFNPSEMRNCVTSMWKSLLRLSLILQNFGEPVSTPTNAEKPSWTLAMVTDEAGDLHQRENFPWSVHQSDEHKHPAEASQLTTVTNVFSFRNYYVEIGVFLFA